MFFLFFAFANIPLFIYGHHNPSPYPYLTGYFYTVMNIILFWVYHEWYKLEQAVIHFNNAIDRLSKLSEKK